jgi:hypothetical protein
LQHFQTPAFASFDIDLFFYGLRDKYERASKIADIYQWVKSYSSGEDACIRTAKTIAIVSQHLERNIHVILDLYTSPAEILATCNTDSCSVAYDRFTVYASHWAFIAFVAQTSVRTDLSPFGLTGGLGTLGWSDLGWSKTNCPGFEPVWDCKSLCRAGPV